MMPLELTECLSSDNLTRTEMQLVLTTPLIRMARPFHLSTAAVVLASIVACGHSSPTLSDLGWRKVDDVGDDEVWKHDTLMADLFLAWLPPNPAGAKRDAERFMDELVSGKPRELEVLFPVEPVRAGDAYWFGVRDQVAGAPPCRVGQLGRCNGTMYYGFFVEGKTGLRAQMLGGNIPKADAQRAFSSLPAGAGRH